MRRSIGMWMLALALLAPGALAQATRVELRSTVRLDEGAALTLGAVAAIDGPQAEPLAGIGLGGAASSAGEHGWRAIGADAIRELIDADGTIHAGSVVVEGSGVRLRRVAGGGGGRETPDAAPEPTRTVRDHVERWLRDRYDATGGTMRYDARDRDADFLRLPTEGRLVEIREVSRRGRTALRVVVYEGDSIVGDEGLLLDVRLKRGVLVATRRLLRGDRVNETVTERRTRWVAADTDTIDPDRGIGLGVSRTINKGQIITRELVERPLVIERGDIVVAKSISGGVVVTMQGRAQGDARDGELVELESKRGDASFTVRATGPGKGVIIDKTTASGGGS